jgi:hypothetical protein
MKALLAITGTGQAQIVLVALSTNVLVILHVHQAVNEISRGFVCRENVLQPFFMLGNIARPMMVHITIALLSCSTLGRAHLGHGTVESFPEVRTMIEFQQKSNQYDNAHCHCNEPMHQHVMLHGTTNYHGFWFVGICSDYGN